MGLSDLDDETYQHLMEELPQLKQIMRTRQLSYRRDPNKSSPFDAEEDDFDASEDEYVDNSTLEYDDENGNSTNAVSFQTTRMPFRTHWPQRSANKTRPRAWYDFFSPYIGKRVARCFWCGLNMSGIPRSPLCHDMFDSNNAPARVLRRFYRAYCYHNSKSYAVHRKRPWTYGGYRYVYNSGLINEYYGRFMGGCFKRFLDVGEVYTQRGCRYWWPRTAWHIVGEITKGKGRTFASHRFKMLEAILKKYKNKCIISPHASLTPFARGISLYVRYHVCVCNRKYCNAAAAVNLSRTAFFTSQIVVLLLGIYLVF